MIKAPPTPKGFRDILPELAAKRRGAINTIVAVLKEFGFVPIETPTIEFAETLTGKYGEEEKLIYKFKDRGDRELALRYDLTVPLARFIASNQALIAKGPFSRYQIGQVFRGENPQAGRWREFTQFDFDTVGPLRQSDSEARSNEAAQDAKIIACAIKATRKLGLAKAQLAVNDRQNFENIPVNVIRAYDKLHKIGKEGVEKELVAEGYTNEETIDYLKKLENSIPTDNLIKIFEVLESEYKLEQNKDFFFDKTLARGLDYYTGAIFELKPDENPASLSIGAGGRYDNLIGMFAGKQIPAVGFSFGLDRLTTLLP